MPDTCAKLPGEMAVPDGIIEKRFVSYAQNLEDVMLWRALGAAVPEGGFYVDVGASDPTLLSVTRAFYDRGWRGVDVEPLPEQAARLAEARPRDIVVQAAADAAPGQAAFYRVRMHRQTGLSTADPAEAERHQAAGAVVETIETRVVTLAELFRAHVKGPVHFLKVDVEGAEKAVLAGLDLSAVRPWIIVVEATAALTEVSSIDWEPGLLAAQYRLVWFDGLNRFYLADEHAELAQHFTVQPNVFDSYTVYDPVLQPHLERLEALARDRLEAKQAVELERDRLLLEIEKMSAAAAKPVAPPLIAPSHLNSRPAAPPPAPLQPKFGRSLARAAAIRVYRLFRPVIRPVAWRLRNFLVGDVRRELFELSQRQEQLLSRSPVEMGGFDATFLASMERLMLTLALEQGRDAATTLRDGGQERVSGLSNAESGR